MYLAHDQRELIHHSAAQTQELLVTVLAGYGQLDVAQRA